jgi:arylsulfatase A-like enzyme
LLPTLLDATGLPTPTEVAGRSLLPNLLGMATDGPRDFAITYAGALPYSGPGLTRALRRQGTKYVQRMTGWARLPRGPLEVLWSFNALAEGSLADDEYYDLTADPGETRNLIRSRRDAARLDKQVLEAFVDYLGAEAPESRLIRPEDLTPEALQSLRDLGYIR